MLDDFILGFLFTYLLYSKTYYLHVLSFVILIYHTFRFFAHKQKIRSPSIKMEIPNLLMFCFILLSENALVEITKIQRFRVFMRLGGIIMLGGYLFFIYAAIYYITSGRKFVFDGPYRYMRHPVYTGILISTLGCVIYLGTYGTGLYLYYVLKDKILKAIWDEECEMECVDEKYRKYKEMVKMFYL